MKLQLTAEQYAVLLEEIPGYRVRQLRGQSHLEAWDVRRTLNRIFGFGGWDLLTKQLAVVAQIEIPPSQPNGKPRWTVVYTAEVRLEIKNPDGSIGAVYEDGAAGDSQNQPSLGDAHDQALKTALSQGLKRCVVNLGDQFGLSLYNDGQTRAVVNRTLAPPADVDQAGTVQVDETPVQGEPEAQGDTPPDTPAGAPAESAADRLNAMIASASDKDQLSAAWKTISAAVNAEAIDVEQRDQLTAAWKERRAQVLPRNPGNDPARRKMMALFTEAELTDRTARLAFASEVAGREVASTNQLADAEVSAVIDRLQRYIEQSQPQASEPVGASA